MRHAQIYSHPHTHARELKQIGDLTRPLGRVDILGARQFCPSCICTCQKSCGCMRWCLNCLLGLNKLKTRIRVTPPLRTYLPDWSRPRRTRALSALRGNVTKAYESVATVEAIELNALVATSTYTVRMYTGMHVPRLTWHSLVSSTAQR